MSEITRTLMFAATDTTGLFLPYPVLAAILIAGLLTAILHVFLHRRRHRVTCRMLPVRILAVDREEKILYLSAPDFPEALLKKMRSIRDLPGLDYDKISEAIKESFRSEAPITVDYTSGQAQRMMTITPLARSVYGRDAVVCVSQDNRFLQEARKRAEDLAEQFRLSNQNLELARSLAKISSFERKLDRTVCKDAPDTNFWPMTPDGKMIPVDAYIHPDDKAVALRTVQRLENGEITLAHCTFRTDYFGAPRYFNLISMRRDPTGRPDDVRIFGVIQDMTELEVARRKYSEANKLIHDVIDVLPYYFFAKDADDGFRYVMANKAFSRFAGRVHGEISGRTDHEMFPRREDVEKFRKDDERIIASGKREEYLEQVMDATGQMRWVRMVKTALRTESGKRLLFGVGLDVTELEEAKHREKENRLLLQSLMDNMGVALAIKDPKNEFRYLFCNREYERLSGLSERKIAGKNEAQLQGILPGNRLLALAQDEDSMQRNHPVETVNEGEFPGQEHKLWQVTRTPVHVGDKSFLLMSYVDLTRMNRLVETEKFYNEALKRLLLERSFKESLHAIFEMLSKHLHCDRITFGTFSSNGRDYHLEAEYCSKDIPKISALVPPMYKTQDGPELFSYFYSGRVFVESDVPNSGLADNLAPFGTQSFLLAPVLVNSTLWGLLSIGFVRSKRRITPEDVSFVKSIASILSLTRLRDMLSEFEERQTREKRMILDGIQIPVLFYNARGTLLGANAKACKLLERSEEEVLRLTCADMFRFSSPTHQDCQIHKVQETRLPQEQKGLFAGHSCLIHAEPVLDENGRLTHIIQYAHLLPSAEDNRPDANENAVSGHRPLVRFLAAAAHELQKPLNAILGFTELLSRGNPPPALREKYSVFLESSGQEMRALVGTMSDFVELENNGFTLTPSYIDVAKLFRDAVSFYANLAKKKQLYLNLEIGPIPALFLDAVRIQRVLGILLDFALRYTEHGGITFSAHFEPISREDGNLAFSVGDTGPGIPPEYANSMFDPLHASDADPENKIGPRLELGVTQKIIQRMGGTITHTSTPGRGTTFHVFLRRVRFRSPEANSPSPLSSVASALPGFKHGVRILLAEDSETHLRLLSGMLTKLGASCFPVSSRTDAVRLILHSPPDLILSGLGLADGTAMDLADDIAPSPATQNIPVVVLLPDSKSAFKIPVSRFSGIMPQPVTLDRLRALGAALHAGKLYPGAQNPPEF